jgi:hypothetical protein
VAVVAIVVVLVLGRSREDDAEDDDPLASKEWARSLLQQLEHEGRVRGRPRRSDESVVAYGRALVEGVLPDERVLTVASALDRDLFARDGLHADERAAIERSLADAAAAYPPGWERDAAPVGATAGPIPE